jgi:hypothetical protein
MKVYDILYDGRSNETRSAVLLSEKVEADKSSSHGL